MTSMHRLPFVLLPLLLISPLALGQKLFFINPGNSDELFWNSASQAMAAAARSLGARLEERYTERDPGRSMQIARELAARPAGERPDYVILVNEKGTLVENAQALGEAGIKTFAINSGLLPQERQRFAPRRGLPLLVGSLVPDARHAGYLSAKALIAKSGRKSSPIKMLSIAGDRSTPSSLQRVEGLRQALAEHPEVVLAEQVFADWRRDRGEEAMTGLLRRHPDVALLWSVNDQMALGAIAAIERSGMKSGQDVLVSGMNTSQEAMQAVRQERLAVLAGGHFMVGAWAVVMLHDLHHGRDFADEGLELERPMFMLFDKALAQRFQARFEPELRDIDFRPYSKVLNPNIKRYEFSLAPLLR